MGHFHADNISRVVNRLLHAGDMSIKSCVDELERTNTKFRASEGAYGKDSEDYREMLFKGVMEIVHQLFEWRLVEPHDLSRKQQKIFRQWARDDIDDWDAGDDGKGGEYGVFDSIKWQPLKKRLPVIREIES